jgi:beta-phosphoglucomutase
MPTAPTATTAPTAPEPAALILDLDGVVTDTADQHAAAWRSMLAEHGLPFHPAAYERTRGRSRSDSLRELLGGHEVPDDVFATMLERKNARYLEALDRLTLRDLLPGVLDLLLAAEQRHWKVAIGSSSRNAGTVLDRIGVTDLFDAVADGSTGDPKPAPDIFLAAARMLEVDPAACIVVEDAASGVEAAIAAGMRVIGVGPAERVGRAHVRVDSTAELVLDVLEPLIRSAAVGSAPA